MLKERFIRIIRNSAFTVSIYLTLFWLRVIDIINGTNVSDNLVWLLLWAIPIIYIEPKIRRTLITEYWIRRELVFVVDMITLLASIGYIAFIKFIRYGALLTNIEVAFLILVMILYNIIMAMRKIEGWYIILALFVFSLLNAYVLWLLF